MSLLLTWQSCWHRLLMDRSYHVALFSGRAKAELQLPNVLFLPGAVLAVLGSLLRRWQSAELLFVCLVPKQVWCLSSIGAGVETG